MRKRHWESCVNKKSCLLMQDWNMSGEIISHQEKKEKLRSPCLFSLPTSSECRPHLPARFALWSCLQLHFCLSLLYALSLALTSLPLCLSLLPLVPSSACNPLTILIFHPFHNPRWLSQWTQAIFSPEEELLSRHFLEDWRCPQGSEFPRTLYRHHCWDLYLFCGSHSLPHPPKLPATSIRDCYSLNICAPQIHMLKS